MSHETEGASLTVAQLAADVHGLGEECAGLLQITLLQSDMPEIVEHERDQSDMAGLSGEREARPVQGDRLLRSSARSSQVAEPVENAGLSRTVARRFKQLEALTIKVRRPAVTLGARRDRKRQECAAKGKFVTGLACTRRALLGERSRPSVITLFVRKHRRGAVRPCA